MLRPTASLALGAGLLLAACTGSRERAQESPAPQSTVQETIIEQDSAEQKASEERVRESQIPGVGHGSGVPGYDETESGPPARGAEETVLPTRQEEEPAQPQTRAPASRAGDEAQPGDESVQPSDIPQTRQGRQQDEDTSEPFMVTPESGVLQPESGEEQEEGAPSETVIPSDREASEAINPGRPTRHTDFGRDIQTEEIIPDSTTEQSGLPEGTEQVD